jgi:hypothetical protein
VLRNRDITGHGPTAHFENQTAKDGPTGFSGMIYRHRAPSGKCCHHCPEQDGMASLGFRATHSEALRDMTESVPEGFQPLVISEGFIDHNGPYFWRQDAAGAFDFGFLTNARHGNPNGVLHGDAVLGFLDTILGHAVVRVAQRRCATVSLDSRFIAAAARAHGSKPHRDQESDAKHGILGCGSFCGRQAADHAAAVFRIFES